MSYEQYRPSGFKVLPEVVKNLLIVNGIFFLATFVLQNRGVDLTDTLGLQNPLENQPQWLSPPDVPEGVALQRYEGTYQIRGRWLRWL